MAGKRKTSFAVYGAWEYDREERALDKASKEGWQLVKGGCFHSVFEKDEGVRYIYQLDYNTSVEDRDRYIETFDEQGWEYVNSTYNGWHYFRKKYCENMSDEEKHIYTDRQSLTEMQNRFAKFLLIFGIIEVLICGISITHLIGLKSFQVMEPLILDLLIAFIMLYGYNSIRLQQKGKKPLFNIPAWVFMLLLIMSVILIFWPI